MPYYIFQSPVTHEIKEIFQHMEEPHIYEEDNIKWQRIWLNPQANVDTKWNEDSPQNFVEQTAKKRGTINDLWLKSKELSEKRKQKHGIDTVEVEANKNYKKNHRGHDMPHIKMEKLKRYLDSKGFELNQD